MKKLHSSCFVENTQGVIRKMMDNGYVITSEIGGHVCCCYEDCFQMYYICAQDSDCCSNVCREGICMKSALFFIIFTKSDICNLKIL